MSVLEKGTILEQTYEIMEEIGSGGGGIIYRAKHLRLQTDVVVKKIKDEVRGRVKSRQEADILKNLKHPYLPRVYDFIETPNGVYTVMDFIHGEDLGAAVKKHGKFSEKQVRKWARQLGEALDYLHSQKPAIIHSDIKPANIMLTKDDNVCLIDFNISLAMGGDMESAVGISAGFSPPEQYRDPVLYEKITHNYAERRSASTLGKDNVKVRPDVEDNKTEVLIYADTDKTELLRDDDRTELLIVDGRTDLSMDNDGTKLLIGNDKTELLIDDDRTELLADRVDSKTELLTDTGTDGESAAKSHTSKYVQYIGRGINERSDIYSLGITFYYMLTGIEPSVDFEKRIPLTETSVHVSEGFTILLEKMTELDPAKRYQNGSEFLKAIRNCYKLDRRYIMMHRRELGIQITSFVCLCMSVLFVFGGMYQIRRERNSAYYGFLQRAVEAMNQSEYDYAGALLEEAKEVYKERIDAYEEEIHLLYLSENYEECISLGENYINTLPFQANTEEDNEQLGNICYVVGNAYFETQDYANAAKLFEYALAHYSENGLYYRDYAITLAKMGQTENAERELQKGIERNLGQDSIYMAQGEIAHVKEQNETAIECLQQTIAITDDIQMKKRAILLCIDVYKTIGEAAIDEEIALLEQYDSQFEGNGKLVMTEYLAEAYFRKAKTDEAQADSCYHKALDLFRSIYEQGYVTYQLQENMAILYENMKRFDEAEELLLEMAESYPDRYEVYKRLSYLEADRQQEKENEDRDYQQMLTYYEQALELYPEERQDAEMEMLGTMMQEIREGGWL